MRTLELDFFVHLYLRCGDRTQVVKLKPQSPLPTELSQWSVFPTSSSVQSLRCINSFIENL